MVRTPALPLGALCLLGRHMCKELSHDLGERQSTGGMYTVQWDRKRELLTPLRVEMVTRGFPELSLSQVLRDE